MKKIVLAFMVLVLTSCTVLNMKTEMPFTDERADICKVYTNYLKSVAMGNLGDAQTYEDKALWQNFDPNLYVKLRSLHPEFGTLLARSTVKFTECTKQKEWGMYGKTYDSAWMFSFMVEPSAENLTPEEKVYAAILKGKTFTTVGVLIEGHWKFLPVFGPELLEIDMATKAYEEYIQIISKGDFLKIYDYTPNAMRTGFAPQDIKDDWDKNASQLPELVKLCKPTPVAGRVVFQPNFAGTTYPWGVYLDIVFKFDKASQIKDQTEQTKMIIDDYKRGLNMVLMVFEDGWKPITLNPLFGLPDQETGN